MFSVSDHVKYYKVCLNTLPEDYIELDTQRIVLLYFCVLGLDILDALDNLSTEEKDRILLFVNNCHLKKRMGDVNIQGYRGSTFCGKSIVCNNTDPSVDSYWSCNLAMTYSGLAIKIALKDPISKQMKEDIIQLVQLCVQEDGSVASMIPDHTYATQTEADIRFVYCAFVILYLLHSNSNTNTADTTNTSSEYSWNNLLNLPLICSYIKSCFTYEGGFSLIPGAEAQGGATYCAVASLVICNQLHTCLNTQELELLEYYCLNRYSMCVCVYYVLNLYMY